jgi:arsenate reductase (thioredoxin)
VKILAPIVALLALSCGMAAAAEDTAAKQIVFVCEHGNVKSLMAASYFNQLAEQQHLPFHATSRGAAPDSTTVPTPIVAGLRADGVDVSAFHPVKLGQSDLADAAHVVMIGIDLPASLQAPDARIEKWQDVPPASTNYAPARAALQAHVADLIARLKLACADATRCRSPISTTGSSPAPR